MAKKLFALLLAILMVLSMAACNKAPAPTDPTKGNDPAPTDPAPETQGPPVEITFLVPFEDASTNWTNIEKKLNEISVKEINVKVNYEFVAGSADYTQRVALEAASGTCAELVFTCSWGVNNFDTAVANEYLYDISDLWEKYTPDVQKQMVPGCMASGSANGVQYAIPNQQMMATQKAFAIQKDIAEKYGWTLTEFDATNPEHFKALEDFMAKIRDNEPDLIPYSGNNNVTSEANFAYKTEQLWQELYIDHDKDSTKVVYSWEIEGFDWTASDNVRKYFNEGYMHPAMASKPDINSLQTAGKIVINKGNYMPGVELTFKNTKGGMDQLVVPITPGLLLTTSYPKSTMLGVSSSATEETAIAALKVINLLWANEEYYNTFLYGLEGTNYTKNANGQVVPSTENKHDYYINGWAFGNQFNSWTYEGQDPDVYKESKELSFAAVCSPLMGFAVSVADYATEVANLADVRKTYELPTYAGVSDAEYKAAVEARKQALLDAGLDTIKDGLQAQLDAWLKANGK